ncbi:MAG: GNAT family N-acetyltransferase [Hyphomicrobiaceae bacterium]
MLALKAPWLQLEAGATGHTFFQSYGWCRHIMLELNSEDAIDPLAVTAWDADQLVAIWPLRIARSAGARVVSSLGWPYDQSSGILALGDRDCDRLVKPMAQVLRAADIADGMVMHKARKGSPICALTEVGAKIVDDGSSAPQVTIDTRLPFSAFLQGISSKTRKNIRNYENRLSRLGTVEHRVLTGAEAQDAITSSFDARRDWLDAKAMSSSAFRDVHFAKIVQGLARRDRVNLDVIVFALTLDRRFIAVQWGFIHGGRYYAYLSARDPAYEAYSVGRIHLQHVLKECHARNIGHVDLMVPAVPYKTTWSDRTDVMVDLVWPWTLRGNLVIDFFGRRIRPLLKTVAGQMPDSVRRTVYARLNSKRSANPDAQPPGPG